MRLLRALRSVVEKVVPDRILAPLMAERSRRHQVQYLRNEGFIALADTFIAHNGLEVKHGPFRGMRYTLPAARHRIVIPKLLGCYERELHGVVTQVQQGDYDVIVDVGCAEGYYSTGLALTTKAKVIAFDAEQIELAHAREMARENRVEDRIEFRSWCNANALIEIARAYRRPFLLSDCEGYEVSLFTPEVIAELRHADLLIELHGDAKPIFMLRFAQTHRVEIICFNGDNRGDYEQLKTLPPDKRAQAVSELRSAQEWLWAQHISD
ncbi:MAG TPA: class I SAM-dependent methyltransferase [Terriglobales bacterium]|nr:class I SAM-dependent methyltransferase [Terriglobales bacterium]